MPGRKSKTPLADQHMFLSPQLDIGADPEDGSDLDLIASTYRSVLDDSAFEDMIAGWESRLTTSGAGTPQTKVSRRLLGQLAIFRDTLDNLGAPVTSDPLKVAVSEVPGPALVISPNGRVATINISGERAFGVRQGGQIDPARIAPGSREDYDALLRASGERHNGAHAILTILPAAGEYGETLLAEAYLLRAAGQNRDHIAIRSLEIAWAPRAGDRLQQAFGLTQAECEVAELFFQSRNLDAIAQRRGVSLLTIRTQIKTIMGKMGAPSNVELMRLLAMVASREQVGLTGAAPVWHDPLNRESIIQTGGGRRIAWTWMGDRHGLPVVLSRGMTMTYLLPADCEARLKEAGICLYLLSRPGYGNSTIDASLDVMEDNRVALRAFLDRIVGRPCLGVGQADGVLPLVAEAAADPRRFHGLLAVGYAGGFDIPGLQRLPKIQRVMLQLAGSAPWVAELMAKSGHRMMRQHGLDWYLERAFRTNPINQVTLRNPDWTALIRNACEHALKQGHVTFVRELQLTHFPIDPALQALAIPLLYLAPLDDPGIDLDACGRLGKLNPRITVEPVPDAAELILYQRSDLVLDRIIAMARQKK
ncbi:helix-turn-helix transcriptional regulator [Paracoccus shandongensis]|uniref:helix-turn-helix transcriptional regulator n=1 Tax=Paracoccus shandongensis TaxID=2816048 RepID=UPI001A8E5E58|nr:LuxR C-terminal-related transcriptional regulator [Paracoccus shandongensis]